MSLKIRSHFIPGLGGAYSPPGDGPFPAIMLLHGSEGAWSGWSHRTAVLLAMHGFFAFPFGYSKGGNGWNAGNIIDVPLDETVEGLATLRAHPCAGKKIGLYGTSRGAEHALLLTSLMVRDQIGGLPDAVAAHAPSDSICGGFNARIWRDVGDPGWRSWDNAERAWSWRGSTEELLPSTPIEIERFDGPLFLSHGTADTMWSVDMTKRLEKRLRNHGRTPEIHYYEGQDHMPLGADDDAHLMLLLDFFERHLAL